MASTTMRISDRTRAALRELAAREGEPMQAIMERAVEQYRRRTLLEEVNAAYAALREDAAAWAEIEAERREWDAALADGLPANEQWHEDGSASRAPKAQ